jgi:hypothetical protein
MQENHCPRHSLLSSPAIPKQPTGEFYSPDLVHPRTTSSTHMHTLPASSQQHTPQARHARPARSAVVTHVKVSNHVVFQQLWDFGSVRSTRRPLRARAHLVGRRHPQALNFRPAKYLSLTPSLASWRRSMYGEKGLLTLKRCTFTQTHTQALTHSHHHTITPSHNYTTCTTEEADHHRHRPPRPQFHHSTQTARGHRHATR